MHNAAWVTENLRLDSPGTYRTFQYYFLKTRGVVQADWIDSSDVEAFPSYSANLVSLSKAK